MEKRGYPSVFVVDSSTTQPQLPPLPPRPTKEGQRGGAAQTLLFMLVGLALCGMIIEACFIYHLYQPKSDSTSAESSKLIGGEAVVTPTAWPINGLLPSKPVAHLTDGQDVSHKKHIMAWSTISDPLVYEMDFKDTNLIIQKEGYYYVYSKVYFLDSKLFYHVVELHTNRYLGGNITLLQSRRFTSETHGTRSNSYLGGVFHFYQDDAVYVKVSDTAKIERHKPYENVFGAFMI